MKNHKHLPNQFQFLHNSEMLALLQHRSRSSNTELRCITIQFLNSQQSCRRRHGRSIKSCLAVHVLWSVLDHSETLVGVLHSVHGDGLESSPAVGDDERIVGLEDTAMPTMLLNAYLNMSEI